MIEATKDIVKAGSFHRINDFGFEPEIKNIVLSRTSDPSMLILWARRADYYNSPILLAEPLSSSLLAASMILDRINGLGLIFHETRPARFFRTVFAVITAELPNICIPSKYESQIMFTDSCLNSAFERMGEILRPDEFDALKDFYGFKTNRPRYYPDDNNNEPKTDLSISYLAENARRKLSHNGSLYLYYRSGFKMPD